MLSISRCCALREGASKRHDCASMCTFATVDSTVCQTSAKIGALAPLQKHHAVQALNIADIDHKQALWLPSAEDSSSRGIEYADMSLCEMRAVLCGDLLSKWHATHAGSQLLNATFKIVSLRL